MKKNNRHFLTLFPVVLAVILFSTTSLYGQPAEQDEEIGITKPSTTTILADATDKDFEYKVKDRGDPFLPFLVEKKKSVVGIDMNAIVDADGDLSGMQLFEPDQLTLVAIVRSTREHFGMVQDFTGKGYIVTEGMNIGKRGMITDIVPNQVIIEETAYTRAGKKLTNEIIMYLKQEGDER